MPGKTNRNEATMAVLGQLREHAMSGFCSEIVYDKGKMREEPLRLIEPLHYVQGVAYVMVRAFQHRPEKGVRMFCPERIVRTSMSTTKRTKSCGSFLEAEVKSSANCDRAGPNPGPRIGNYMQLVRAVMTDLTVDEDEMREVGALRTELRLSLAEVRAAHAIVFGEILHGLSCDLLLDSSEEELMERAIRCLDELGWAPQT